MKKTLFALLLALFIAIALSVTTLAVTDSGIDDPVPCDATISLVDSYAYKIYLPESESTSTNPNNLLLNLLSYSYPSYGTNLTKAPDTNNNTQWFRRMRVTLDGSTYYIWAPYNDTTYCMNCRRLDTTGSYLNVVPSKGNNRGDLNIHSPHCFDTGQSSHYLAAPPRDMQTSVMVVCSTGESTGYTNNTYLKWGSTSSYQQNAQPAFIYRINYGYISGYCLH